MTPGHLSHLFLGGVGAGPGHLFKKAKQFEVKTSTVLSTQVYPEDNCIVGFYKAVKTYEQQITWGQHSNAVQPFSLTSINVYCECKFYDKETKLSGKCCRHITGQLRRVVFFLLDGSLKVYFII